MGTYEKSMENLWETGKPRKSMEIYGKSMKIYGDVSELCDFSSGYFMGISWEYHLCCPKTGKGMEYFHGELVNPEKKRCLNQEPWRDFMGIHWGCQSYSQNLRQWKVVFEASLFFGN